MGKHHDKDFKIYAARLVLEEGRKPRELAEELNISIPTLRNWINNYKETNEEGLEDSRNGFTGLSLKEEKDKIIKDLQEENEILKKAMHIFTKQP
ncbi:transposase [Peribacillus simplex]|uniref:Transposase n=1 Tax=Peribacillus simplex TaxID=1478 RepID=A0AAW7IKD6_9BACI|nr:MULTISPECIES: transposase [Peribacillus]SNT12671.1 transposase [Bacillus sp. OK838]AMM91749.1 transposase [Peribacillus simplex]MDF9763372.1 transposase [Peribacillus simplex]MDM5296297.1 transposase [Peribacillus simplex]MDM5455333.1 transposase [Peribacillus simplex]